MAPPPSPAHAPSWAARNWRIIAAAVATVGAVSLVAYAVTARAAPPPTAGSSSDAAGSGNSPSSAATARRKRKSANKRSAAAKAASAAASAAPQSPEDASTESIAAASPGADSPDAVATASTAQSPKEPIDVRPPHLFPEDISALSSETRESLAQEAKTIGNKLYSSKNYADAIELYTQAIALASSAVFYGNRAAAYSNLYEYENAISDCNEALKLDSKYLKALHRRANAYENLDRLKEALDDYTAVCVLEGFRNQNSMTPPDRVLKTIVTRKAKEMMKTKVPRMPSPTFICAYLDSFRTTPSHADIVSAHQETDATKKLSAAFDAIKRREWQTAFDDIQQSLELGEFGSDAIAAIAYNMDATFQFLMGRTDQGLESIEKSLELDPENINSIIKCATLYMEKGTPDKTLELFERAEKIAPHHVDFLYHRGQVHFLTGNFKNAVEDYSESIKHEKPEESSVYVHIQMGVAKYKLGDISGAEKKFKEAKRLFPNSAEVFNYHGEILMDREAFTEALKSFDKSIEMDTESPLPYINKSLLLLQWKQNFTEAEAHCRMAIEKDPLCDIAYTHLGQILCHQNKIEEAVPVYDQAAAVSRTEAEIVNVLSCREAAGAQLHVMRTYPGIMESLALART